MIIIYGIYSIKHYDLFFKEHNFFIMSQNRHTSNTSTTAMPNKNGGGVCILISKRFHIISVDVMHNIEVVCVDA